ncbi:AMP-binding protein [Streptomyces gilvus]|uniref:AMP-binding protein n=1 Tax=Streptomyces gilvus TaxID=2920937 RepID=UPI001F0D7FCE|nr:AMP-binding protein [Streptomyces sp. CME 23]MCH5675561.1 AMP-binding protein [Streptomyces sp. CME 23]
MTTNASASRTPCGWRPTATGNREAIVEGDLRLTFGQLEEAMDDAVRAAIAHGIGPGDRVAVWAPNSTRWILAALAIQGAEGILVPLNTRFGAGPPDPRRSPPGDRAQLLRPDRGHLPGHLGHAPA